MNKFSTCVKTLVAIAAAAAGISASATPIIGIANLTIGQVVIRNGSVDWNNDPANLDPPPNGATTTYGGFAVIPLKTGSFLSVPTLSLGTIRDLADTSIIPTETGNNFPVGTPTLVTKFLTFAAKPNWIFDATYLVPGTAGSPFALTQSGANVAAAITINGIACDAGVDGICDPTDDKTKWTGLFTANYTNTTIAAIFATVLGGGALDNNSWSGTIEASKIPEPASLALVGLALGGLGLAARRRKM